MILLFPKIKPDEKPTSSMDIEKQWVAVKEHYERAYKIKFQSRPADSIIIDLHKKMTKLSSEIQNHFERKRLLDLTSKARN